MIGQRIPKNELIRDMLRNGVQQAVIVRTLGVTRGRVSGIASRARRGYALCPPGPTARTPSREAVERITREVAAHYGIDHDVLLSPQAGKNPQRHTRARRAAIARIVRETGCSGNGLAKVWGVSEKTVHTAIKRMCGGYDANTIGRLTWVHGATRTGRIIAGRDVATQTDIAAWDRLGGESLIAGDAA